MNLLVINEENGNRFFYTTLDFFFQKGNNMSSGLVDRCHSYFHYILHNDINTYRYWFLLYFSNNIDFTHGMRKSELIVNTSRLSIHFTIHIPSSVYVQIYSPFF